MKNKSPKLFLLLCLLVMSFAAGAQENPFNEYSPNAEKFDLKGRVKTLEVFSVANGSKQTYAFNAAGKVVEYSKTYRNDTRLPDKIVFIYDAAGNKTRAGFFREGKSEKKIDFRYDAKNKLVEETEFDSTGEVFSKTAYKYDEKGRLIERIVKQMKLVESNFLIGIGMPAGEYRDFYTYDENGNLATVKMFFPKIPIPFVDLSARYDSANRKIEESSVSRTDPNKPRIYRNFYYYDKFGSVVETRTYESVKESSVDEVKDRFKITDAQGTVQNGLLISDKPFMILWNINVCDYEYDAAGNWISRSCRWRVRDTAEFIAQPERTMRRSITYF